MIANINVNETFGEDEELNENDDKMQIHDIDEVEDET